MQWRSNGTTVCVRRAGRIGWCPSLGGVGFPSTAPRHPHHQTNMQNYKTPLDTEITSEGETHNEMIGTAVTDDVCMRVVVVVSSGLSLSISILPFSSSPTVTAACH